MLRLSFDQLRSRILSQGLVKWGARLVLLLLVSLASVLLLSFVRMTWMERQINQALVQQREANEALRIKIEQLKTEAEYRESDAYVEQAAREQLGMAREGETVLLPTVVIPASSAPMPTIAAEAPMAKPATPPNYQRWWRAFFPEEASP
jgi:cell division protein FtsB